MSYLHLKRRDFIKGLLGTAATLPLMEAFHAAAQNGAFPKRLIICFSANGTIRENWLPSGTERDFALSPILSPLEAHKQDIVVLDNLRNEAAFHGPGDGHMTGMGCLLTATELLDGQQFKCGGETPCSGWGGGISVDQYIANTLQGRLNPADRTKFNSLELGVQPGSADIWGRMVYAGADQPVAPMHDPSQVFDRVFGDLNVSQADLDRLRAQKRSVLDFVGSQFSRLRSQVSGTDRDKLDGHLSAIRDIEQRLVSGATSTCGQPAKPEKLDPWKNDNFPQLVKLQSDLLVQSLACDMTRVATLQWSGSVSQTRHSWLGSDRGHHDYSHDGDSNAATTDMLTRINTWYAEQFAYLIAQLKAVPEGDGTLLDNTLILWGNELGRGNSHSREKVPFVLAGRAGGALSSGRFLQYDDESHSNLLVSLCQLMGVDTQTFGNPAYATGALRML